MSRRGFIAASVAGFGSALLPRVSRSQVSREEFVTTHDLLKKAPEATPAIRAELELAEMQSGFFDSAMRTLKPGTSDKRGMTNVFTTSERILQVMDGVTGMYSKLS